MSELEQILDSIIASNATEEQKEFAKKHFKSISKEDKLKDFRIKSLSENLKVNTRFLNETVIDLENTVNLLKDSNGQLKSFVKIASHDLKSPIRSISSFSALLNKMLAGKLNAKEIDYFNIIESSAKSMGALIDDLLLFTRINSEDLNITEEPLTNLLDDVIQNLDFAITSNKVTIKNNTKPIILNCDSIKLKQVLQNLISNGIKFSALDGNKACITLGLDEDPNHWIFSVKDNGIGIEEDFRETIFQEFKKLNGHTYEGTGMGLSIVKKIIDKHKGQIWIDTPDGPGSTFKFTISKDLYPQAH